MDYGMLLCIWQVSLERALAGISMYGTTTIMLDDEPRDLELIAYEHITFPYPGPTTTKRRISLYTCDPSQTVSYWEPSVAFLPPLLRCGDLAGSVHNTLTKLEQSSQRCRRARRSKIDIMIKKSCRNQKH